MTKNGRNTTNRTRHAGPPFPRPTDNFSHPFLEYAACLRVAGGGASSQGRAARRMKPKGRRSPDAQKFPGGARSEKGGDAACPRGLPGRGPGLARVLFHVGGLWGPAGARPSRRSRPVPLLRTFPATWTLGPCLRGPRRSLKEASRKDPVIKRTGQSSL